MVARFMGFRTLEDRRRRRLATQPLERKKANPNELVLGQTNLTQHSSSAARVEEMISVPVTPLDKLNFPIRKLISGKLWKNAMVCFVVVALAGLLVAATNLFSRSRSPSSRAMEALFQIPDGKVFHVFSGVLLIFCAQLSFVIGWARSQSQKDFHGSYRIWRWNALWLFGIAIGLLIDFPPVFAEALAKWGGGFSRYPAEIFWLLPVSFTGSLLVWNLIREMRESQIARLCYWGSLAGVVFILVMRYATGLSIPIDSPKLTLLVVSLSSVCLLLIAMLLQCRHILYRSVDPPERTNSLLLNVLAIFGRMFLKFLSVFHKREREFSDEKKPTDAQQKKKLKIDNPIAKDVSVESLKSKKPKIQRAKKIEKQPEHESKSKSMTSQQKNVTRIDIPLDPELLKGLSKKQRRKLRQAHRQKNRDCHEEIT